MSEVTMPQPKKQGKTARKALEKEVLQISRTSLRNLMDLIQIADNKANVLLSLSSLMLTFLVPMVLANYAFIAEHRLIVPLVILLLTCFTTIYMSARVLMPGRFFNNDDYLRHGKSGSPFFFGNILKMSIDEYRVFMEAELSSKESFLTHVADDLHYLGSRLGKKMSLVRRAFIVFLSGLFLAITLAVIFIFIFHF